MDGFLLRLRPLAGDVGERAGAARGDTVGSERVKEFAKNVVNVELGGEIAAGTGEFRSEVVFALGRFVVQ